MLTWILFITGFIVLIKGADLLVDGSSSIARKLNVSNLIIGLTVVAFGTSAPELFVNVFASLDGNADIAIGNILGSNIANILLILGVSALIFPLAVHNTTTWKEIPFSLLAALTLAVLANDALMDQRDFSELSRGDGLILIAFFCIFIYYIIEMAKKSPNREDVDIKSMNTFKAILYLTLGVAGLVFGGKWIVGGAVAIASAFGVSQSLIGLTVVAIGTSLPELATSAVAAWKKNADIAVGNIVGSNIFNIFWVLGVSAIIKPLPFQSSVNSDVLMTILASLLLFAFIFIGKKHVLQRWQGGLFFVVYITYMILVIIKG